MGTISEESLKEAMEIFEAKFAWLVYIMAVFVGNRPVSFIFKRGNDGSTNDNGKAYLSLDEADEADGQLTTKVIQLMEVNQNLSQGNPAFLSQKFDSALIYFFVQFRKAYVGESNTKSVYKKLNETFGIEGQTDMLNLIMRKM